MIEQVCFFFFFPQWIEEPVDMAGKGWQTAATPFEFPCNIKFSVPIKVYLKADSGLSRPELVPRENKEATTNLIGRSGLRKLGKPAPRPLRSGEKIEGLLYSEEDSQKMPVLLVVNEEYEGDLELTTADFGDMSRRLARSDSPRPLSSRSCEVEATAGNEISNVDVSSQGLTQTDENAQSQRKKESTRANKVSRVDKTEKRALERDLNEETERRKRTKSASKPKPTDAKFNEPKV